MAGNKDVGITYWHPSATAALPNPAFPVPLAFPKDLVHHPATPMLQPFGYVDLDWVSKVCHHWSVSGILLLLGGGAISWHSCVQPTVSTSSTGAKFLAALDAGKTALYVRLVLDKLGVLQTDATILFEDNWSAFLIASACQPTWHS